MSDCVPARINQEPLLFLSFFHKGIYVLFPLSFVPLENCIYLHLSKNLPPGALQRPWPFSSIALAHTLDDEDGTSDDAHQTHNQAKGTHHILCSLWEGGWCLKLWGKIKQSTEVMNVVGSSNLDHM